MRIISGKMRGTVLVSPEGENTRPTTDRVKEGLFSAIQFEIAGARVLDAFSGSGQLALEALSRGADLAVLCEQDKNAVKIIESNIEKTHCKENAVLLKSAFESSVAAMKNYAPFDIVFLDPPYNAQLWGGSIKLLEQNSLLSENCTIICECPKEYIFPDDFKKYNSREYLYGKIKIIIFRKR